MGEDVGERAGSGLARRADAFFRAMGGNRRLYTWGLATLALLMYVDLFMSRLLIDAGFATEGNPLAEPLVMNLPLGVAVKGITLVGFAWTARRVPTRVVGLMLTLLLGIYTAVVVNNVAVI